MKYLLTLGLILALLGQTAAIRDILQDKLILGGIHPGSKHRKGLLLKNSYSREQLSRSPVCGTTPPEVGNSTWVYASRDGSVITFICDVGFRTSTGAESFDYNCTSASPSTGPSEACYTVQCPRPGKMEFASLEWPMGVSVTTADFGTSVDYQCAVGYSGDGEARGPQVVKMQCMDTGNFEFVLETITSCKIIHCSPPLDIPYASLTSGQDPFSVVYYNFPLQYECQKGFVVSTDPTSTTLGLTCGPQGEYIPNDPFPLCITSQCPLPPPTLPHAQATYRSGSISADTRIVFRCDEGFVMSDNPAVSTLSVGCQYLDGVAQYVIPNATCIAAPCLPIPEVTNAFPKDARTVWRYLDSVPFSCIQGYTVGGIKGHSTFEGYCSMQGVWTIDNGLGCSPVQCATSADGVNSNITDYGYLVPFSTYPVEYSSSTTVQCAPGAIVTGTEGKDSSFTVVCGPDGEFTSVGVCAYPCPVIPKLPFATSSGFGSPVEYGEHGVTITCKPGYRTPSGMIAQTVTCNRDGTLTPTEECVPYSGDAGNQGSQWAYQPHSLRDLLQNGLLASEQRKSAAVLFGPSLWAMVAVLLLM